MPVPPSTESVPLVLLTVTESLPEPQAIATAVPAVLPLTVTLSLPARVLTWSVAQLVKLMGMLSSVTWPVARTMVSERARPLTTSVFEPGPPSTARVALGMGPFKVTVSLPPSVLTWI